MISRRFLEDTAAGRIHREVEKRFHQGMGKVELNMVFVPFSENTTTQEWKHSCRTLFFHLSLHIRNYLQEITLLQTRWQIQSQPVSLSCWVFSFPCQGVEHEANKSALERKKKLAQRSCFIIFLLLFSNSQCGNIRLSLESIIVTGCVGTTNTIWGQVTVNPILSVISGSASFSSQKQTKGAPLIFHWWSSKEAL